MKRTLTEKLIPLSIPVLAGLSVLSVVFNIALGLPLPVILICAAGAIYYSLLVNIRNRAAKNTDYTTSGELALGILIALAFFPAGAEGSMFLLFMCLICSNMFFNALIDAILPGKSPSRFLFSVVFNAIMLMLFLFFWSEDSVRLSSILSGFTNRGQHIPAALPLYALAALLIPLFSLVKPELMLLPQGKKLFAGSGFSRRAAEVLAYLAQAVIFAALISCAGIFVLPGLSLLCAGEFRNFKWTVVFPALLYAQLTAFILSQYHNPPLVFIIA
ncbi:MAG: hypothetical protein LBT84_03685, partial [Spirochaetia bacterium]|nr:hypothetical protein [Spirochaetia bacterium]